MDNNFGLRKENNELFYELPLNNYLELMMFRKGINLAMDLITRHFDNIEECSEAKEELDAVNLLSQLSIALTYYDLDLCNSIEKEIENL